MDNDIKWAANWLIAVAGTSKENDARAELYRLIRWIDE